jgi:myxalamid-type polyketide synthase MxaB
MAEIGLDPIDREEGLAVLGRLLQCQQPHVAPMRIDWRRLAKMFPPTPMWADLASGEEAAGAGRRSAIEQIRRAPPEERRAVLIDYLRSQVANVLGWPSPEPVGPRRKLFDLGMDSLTSVQLRTQLEHGLGCSLPLTIAFDYPSVEALADFLSRHLQLGGEEASSPPGLAEWTDEETDRVAAMTDEEVESLLEGKLRDLL